MFTCVGKGWSETYLELVPVLDRLHTILSTLPEKKQGTLQLPVIVIEKHPLFYGVLLLRPVEDVTDFQYLHLSDTILDKYYTSGTVSTRNIANLRRNFLYMHDLVGRAVSLAELVNDLQLGDQYFDIFDRVWRIMKKFESSGTGTFSEIYCRNVEALQELGHILREYLSWLEKNRILELLHLLR